MADPLLPRSPLDGAILPAGPAVTVSRADTLQMVAIALARGDPAGSGLPGPGTSAPFPGGHLLWSGSDRWLALAPPGPDLPAALLARFGHRAVLTDIADGRVALRLAGPAAAEALSRLVPIDLHPRAFPAGAVALTLAGHIAVQLWRESDPDEAFLLLAGASLARSLLHGLRTACAPLNRA